MGLDGPSRDGWGTPETAPRDKIELRALLAPEEGCISKELGVQELGRQAGHGWCFLRVGRLQPSLALEPCLDTGGHWRAPSAFPHEVHLSLLSTASFQ